MVKHKNARPDLEVALHTMNHHRQKEPAKEEKQADHEELKEFHVKRLHDGTFSHVLHDGTGPGREGSTPDLNDIHDALEQHFGTPNDAEESNER